MSVIQLRRRCLLQGGLAGGLMVAVAPLRASATAGDAGGQELQGWVRITRDGSVTVLSNTSEIGQGTGTAIAQILADELDLDWRRVSLAMAPLEKRYFNPHWEEYGTYGSGGVAYQMEPLRRAGAQARAMLVAAAAGQWQVAASECDTSSGEVVHPASGRRTAYGQLVELAARQPVPADAPLMPRERLRYIGRDMPRLDIPAKTDGSAVFGVDVRMRGLLSAAIVQCPVFGGRLAGVDSAPVLRMPGVRQVVLLDDAVAVVADSYWRAQKAADALQPRWDLRRARRPDSARYMAALRKAVRGEGATFLPANTSAAQVKARYAQAARRVRRSVERTYAVPFLAHATLEPMNATARVCEGSAELWVPTQSQTGTQNAVAALLGLPVTAVTVHTTLAGGGFGRRMELDFALQATRIAQACGAPVKLIWSRAQDLQHDFYRPAAVVRVTAGLDGAGMPVALRVDSACESILQHSRLGEWREYARPVDNSAAGDLPDYYRFAAIQMQITTVDVGVPVGFWRAVAATQNVFAYECLMDELAQGARMDALAYRRALLPPDGRERRVLDLLAERSAWQRGPAPGRHRGMAFSRANGSLVGHVVELSVDAGRKVQLHQVWTVIDCGIAVNPHNVRAQVEGCIVFALSAAFHGEITLRGGAVQQSNFHDYRLLGLAATPKMDVQIVENQEKPGGAGEEAVGGLAPALVNALFAATGQRIRELPLSCSGFSI
ncbi:MAG: molybdopterin cofactor-binding domain-containing protein [Roseateles sp.]|uniref:molybdopterin cofactor-binding domain-containing protein n=1 Tax=Roseateles sp. TaxID=1971397 RepID=UPI004037561D